VALPRLGGEADPDGHKDDAGEGIEGPADRPATRDAARPIDHRGVKVSVTKTSPSPSMPTNDDGPGDRNSTSSHLVVKVGSWGVTDGIPDGGQIIATAESIADTCNGSHDWSQDRHTATRDTWAIRLPAPPVDTVPG
jgi:hypothetical protein